MQLPAVLKDQEASELSILDIVVHSCRTVIHSLSAEDLWVSDKLTINSLRMLLEEMSLDAGFRDCFLSMSQTGIVISIAFHGFGSGVTITELGQTTLCRTLDSDGIL